METESHLDLPGLGWLCTKEKGECAFGLAESSLQRLAKGLVGLMGKLLSFKQAVERPPLERICCSCFLPGPASCVNR